VTRLDFLKRSLFGLASIPFLPKAWGGKKQEVPEAVAARDGRMWIDQAGNRWSFYEIDGRPVRWENVQVELSEDGKRWVRQIYPMNDRRGM